MPAHRPTSDRTGPWVFGGISTRDLPSLYRIDGSGIGWDTTPMEASRSSWGPDMRRSRYDEDDDEDFEDEDFDDDDLDDDEFDEDDDLFDDDEDLEDDEFLEDDEDEDLF